MELNFICWLYVRPLSSLHYLADRPAPSQALLEEARRDCAERRPSSRFEGVLEVSESYTSFGRASSLLELHLQVHEGR